jgi:hypothetical protein
MDEVWKTIAEAPDYEVSSTGRVRRAVADWQGKYLGRVLKPSVARGYAAHVLCTAEGKITRFNQVIQLYEMPNGKFEVNSDHPHQDTGVPAESLDLAEENWQDPVARKALQFIERRQRNRAAIARSQYNGLEQAVAAAAMSGLNREVATEIAYLSGVKPITGAKIMGDPGGEPVAILCKATGLGKSDLQNLWRSMRRPETTAAGEVDPAWQRVQITYDMLAVDRAQTVLRYWNWSLSSALTPALLRAIRDGEEDGLDDYSAPERAAMLALAENFGR